MGDYSFYEELARGRLPLTFQTLPDKDVDKADVTRRKALTRILYGTYQELESRLTHLNQQGAGIFVAVNKMDGKWRSLDNLVSIQAYFVDVDGLDGAGKEAKQQELLCQELPPSMIVNSRNGLHAYWLTDEGEDPSYFTEIELGLIHAFNGDMKAKDAARLLRAPGFYHHKAEPYYVHTTHISSLRYTAGELASAYPAPEVPAAPVSFSHYQPLEGGVKTAKLLALIDYCSSFWNPGNRHEMALGLAGKLWWWGVDEGEALAIMERVCSRAADPDVADRVQALKSTYRRARQGEPVSTYSLKDIKF